MRKITAPSPFDKGWRRTSRLVVNDGFGELSHSFTNQLKGSAAPLVRHTPVHARYEPAAGAKAWAKLLDFFARHMPARG